MHFLFYTRIENWPISQTRSLAALVKQREMFTDKNPADSLINCSKLYIAQWKEVYIDNSSSKDKLGENIKSFAYIFIPDLWNE